MGIKLCYYDKPPSRHLLPDLIGADKRTHIRYLNLNLHQHHDVVFIIVNHHPAADDDLDFYCYFPYDHGDDPHKGTLYFINFTSNFEFGLRRGEAGYSSQTQAPSQVYSAWSASSVVLITTGIQRRRAKKFSQEIAEAAREAAMAKPPVFDEEDDDFARNPYGGGGSGGGGGGHGGGAASSVGGGGYNSGPYSDVSSHGTYHQSPMAPESYNMREIGGVGAHGPAPGEVFDYNSIGAGGAAGAAGAAGIGVARARSTSRDRHG
ncbi:hypothetical protein EST38_g6781 [Candolleomyces aberdarensis]|uniref:Uncharacterized protein n=1 Tax=Candolleomyces aberdarensis TaxID=2316362 RepID=A0A4Q2DGZ1_9AGAR|nr:hypothetical protein EST38_g6781 [Candolleomyces aberdarensis]